VPQQRETIETAAKVVEAARERLAGLGAAHIALPARFHFAPVDPVHIANVAPVPPPDLGPLAAFVGAWQGNGFNTIFRPDSQQTPTPLPIPAGGDNVLELNLTAESLSFSPSLGSVPNRGMVQGDVFLNGVPYLQAINDVTTGQPVGIHVEPGIWIAVPSTSDPAEPTQTFARMASIPHGTTINAQGTASTAPGAPTIPPVDITPFFSSSGQRIRFQSQTAAAQGTARIPQDLTSVPITQAMLDDPNSVLRDQIAGQHIGLDDDDHHLDLAAAAAVWRRQRQHRLPARLPRGHKQPEQFRPERPDPDRERDLLDRDGRAHDRDPTIQQTTHEADRTATGRTHARLARTDVHRSSAGADPAAAPDHHPDETDPVLADGDPELQRPLLATRLSRDTRAGTLRPRHWRLAYVNHYFARA
jgi:hypothetical protein